MKSTKHHAFSAAFQMAAQRRYHQAMDRYNQNYNNDLYRAATSYLFDDPNRNTPRLHARADRLINAALALCGCPSSRIDLHAKWTDAEIAFLNLFA